MEARALYLYAVVPEEVRLGVIRGIGDEPVEVVGGAHLGVVASDVDVALLAEVNGATDAASLGALARCHDAVVREALATASGLLPFRLGTVLPDRDAARRYLVARADVLGPALSRVEACREWGITVHEISSRPSGGADESLPAESKGHDRPGAGTAYLARRRLELARAQERSRSHARVGASVADELRANAVDATAGRPRGEAVLLCQNYLVRRAAESAFLDAVDRCGDQLAECSLQLELSGPWPPYSFAPGRLLELDRG